MRILVTDADTRAALALVRSLGRRHEVWAGGGPGGGLAGASRWTAGRVELPEPLTGPEAFASAAARFAAANGIEAVLPVTDASTRALLRSGAPPEPPVRLLAASWPAYEALSDKARAVELARRHGLAVPRGALAESPAEAARVARSLGFPVVVKPTHSVRPQPGAGLVRRGVLRVRDESELHACLDELRGEPALIQECVPGRGQGLGVLRWQGRVRGVFAHRRLREKPPAGGVSVLSEGIRADPALQKGVEGILEDLGYEGLAMAEFRVAGRQAWLMEFNARPWGSLQLAVDSGVDFPALYVDCLRGRPAPTPPAYVPGRRLRWGLGDLDHALALARGAVANDGRTGWRAALRVVLLPSGPGTRFELLRPDDPWPFVRAVARWLRGRE